MFDKFKEMVKGVVDHQKAAAEQRSRDRGYKDEAIKLLVDLNPHPQKFATLLERRAAYRVSQESAMAIHNEIFVVLVGTALRKEWLARQDLNVIEAFRLALGSDWSALKAAQIQALQFHGTLVNISEGNLPRIDPAHANISTQPGEVVHLEIGCAVLEEHIYHEHVRSRGTFSVRIARGVYYHPGGTRGRTITSKEIVIADQGVLSITSQRIAFIGSRQNFSSPWSKVLHAEPMSDSLALAFTNRKKSILLRYVRQDHTAGEIVASLVSRLMN